MQFHGYRVDPVHRTVTAPNGRVVRLEPKAFDLLAHLTAHPDEIFSREQLIADVWRGKFVTDDVVMVAVYALRQAFDDDSREPHFIETIRGRGYRWIAKVSDEATAVSLPAKSRRPRTMVAIIAIVLLSGFGAMLWAVLRSQKPMPSIGRTTELIKAHARGVFFSDRTTAKELEEARDEFRKAIEIDGRFAEPHAALAEVCVRLIEVGAGDATANEREARREVTRAIDLAPDLPISQAALATVQFVLDRNARQAELTFRRAIELDPSLPQVHRRYSYLLGAAGRFDEAAQQAQIGVDLDPVSAGALIDLAWTHLLAGRLGEAERVYRDAVHLDPANASALVSLGYCLEMRNENAEAMSMYRRAMQIRGVPDATIAAYGRVFETSGMRGVYATQLAKFRVNPSVPRFMLAFYAVRAGLDGEAIEFLRESARRNEPGTLWLAVHPAFAALRSQREFTALVASSFHTR